MFQDQAFQGELSFADARLCALLFLLILAPEDLLLTLQFCSLRELPEDNKRQVMQSSPSRLKDLLEARRRPISFHHSKTYVFG